MKNLYLLILASLLMLPTQQSNAASCVQQSNRLGLVGLDSSNGTVYARVLASDNGCSCIEFRFTPVNTDTNKALSILLSAKMADKSVRIDATNSLDCYSAYRVYIE